MPKSKATTIEQDDAITMYVIEGETSEHRVHADLVRRGIITMREDGSYTVSVKTVGRRIKEASPKDVSEYWSMEDAEPEEARLVLDVVAADFQASSGRSWPTKNLAAQIARVRRAVPEIPSMWAYQVAKAYQLCTEQGRDSRYLDFALGARPWESAERADWFARLLGAPLPAESLGVHADSLMALLRLTNYRGSLEDMRERFPDYSRDPIPTPRLPASWLSDGIAAVRAASDRLPL